MSRLKIHHHAEAGLPQGEIARLVGCCERTVRNVLAESPPCPTEVAADQLARWGDVLHDRHLAEAILDRILEHGSHIELTGRSWRTRNQDPDDLGLSPTG